MSLDNVIEVRNGRIIGGNSGGYAFVDIDWEDWVNLTAEEKVNGRYYIHNAPGADGTISFSLKKTLWENPSPSASFAAQTVNLRDYDWDVAIIIFMVSSGWYESYFITKSDIGKTFYAESYSSNAAASYSRGFTFNSAASVTFNAQNTGNNTTSSVDNTKFIPQAIYGIQLSQTLRMDVLADSVKATVNYSQEEHAIGTWLDGSTLYEKTIDFGALPNATVKEISSGLSNVTVRDIKGYAKSDNNTICLPFADISGSSSIYPFYTYADNKLKISVNKNQTAYTECYVTLRYTKNS